MSRRRVTAPKPPPAPPMVPDLVLAPELAAIILLELACDVARDALLAEHPTLIDDFRRDSDGPVLLLAKSVCFRAGALCDTLRHYRRAVRDATTSPAPDESTDDDVAF